MGKYSKLGDYLKSNSSNKLTLRFTDVESILGFSLPKSAREYQAWWANNGDSHTHAVDGWLAMGWRTEVDLSNQVVVLARREHLEKTQSNEVNTSSGTADNASEFEEKARTFMSKYYSTPLYAGKHPTVLKIFDMTSDNYEIVGDAKYYTMVRGESLPPAKFAIIAEHVWLLEKTGAKHKFLIFGNDKRVPQEWLKRYGELVDGVDFFFYEIGEDKIERLNTPANKDYF
ncbi:DUF7662 domain-containing protein [Methanolobus chelungpuianus]|uniref:DUF7662 domain-containing protein n=1 Tax=Methanolobus chelungpuianus TaxID=502115 RepID=UPI0021142AC9|nr:hypothetical protein [Methanolobus chelungpuianus]